LGGLQLSSAGTASVLSRAKKNMLLLEAFLQQNSLKCILWHWRRDSASDPLGEFMRSCCRPYTHLGRGTLSPLSTLRRLWHLDYCKAWT